MASASAAPAAGSSNPPWASLIVDEARESYAPLELTSSLDPAIPAAPVRLTDTDFVDALPASAVPWLPMTRIPLGEIDTNRVTTRSVDVYVAFVHCARAGAEYLCPPHGELRAVGSRRRPVAGGLCAAGRPQCGRTGPRLRTGTPCPPR